MHQYSSPNSLSKYFFLALSALSVLCAWLLHIVVQGFKLNTLWWIEFPSVLAFFGIFWRWFDRIGWQLTWLRRLFQIRIPILWGNWIVRAETEFENQTLLVEASAVIKQSWSRLSIVIEWENSKSSSVAASLHQLSLGEYELIYQYLNTPKPLAPQSMNIHRGTAWLALSADGSTLQGEYFSGRGRNRFGQITFTRKQDG